MKHLLFVLAALPLFSLGQGVNAKYDWELAPTSYIPEQDDKDEDVLSISEKYFDEYTKTGNYYTRYELIHIRKCLLSDSGIEQHNKFYVSTKGITKVFKLKARVIQPSGKVIELNKENIIESKGNDGKVQYRYFVFEGIEKGSTIEYLHYVGYKVERDNNGILKDFRSVDINGPIKKKSISTRVTLDNSLIPNFYATNGISIAEPEYTKKRTTYSVEAENVEKIPEEPYGFQMKAIQRVYYNVASSYHASHNTYTSVSNNIYSFVYNEMFTAKDNYEDEFNRFIDTILKFAGDDDLLKLQAIENHIKTNMIYDSEASVLIERILVTNRFNRDGSLKLIAYAAKALGIDAEIVVSCDRTMQGFPADFESELFLESIMIYFPALSSYYVPSQSMRIGPAPKEFISNRGLFISQTKTTKPEYHGFETSHGIWAIGSPDVDYTTDLIETETTIDTLTLQATIDINRSVTGYFAEQYQSNINNLNDEERQELKEDYLEFVVSASATIENMSFQNDQPNDFNRKPFIANATVTSPTLLSESGNKLLINLGTLIGEQTALHRERVADRKLPIDFYCKRRYIRTIRLKIPEGYRVSNLDDFNKIIAPDSAYYAALDTIKHLNVYSDENRYKTAFPKVNTPELFNVTNPPKEVLLEVTANDLVGKLKTKNPLDLRDNSVPPKKTGSSIGFSSTAEVVNNTVVIHVHEWYDRLTFPKEQYSFVVDVMNASADFNALVLVLEKK
jgi:hypothetical protein